MYIKIKRTSCARVGDSSGPVDEYERVDATHLLKHLALHDRKEIDDDTMFALHRYLTSGRAPEGSMDLSHLDGFMTAVTASRDGVAVLTWLPVAWRGGEPEFEDMAEAEIVFSAMAQRCRQIDEALRCTGDLVCIFRRGPKGETLAGDWCRGFMQGIMLRYEQWESAFAHELGRYVLLPITAVAADERALGMFSSMKEGESWCCSDDVMLSRGHPFSVSELPDLWADLRAGAAPDANTTGMSSAEDDEGGHATPSPGSARGDRRADELRERLREFKRGCQMTDEPSLINGESYSKTIGDLNLEGGIRDFAAHNAARHPGTAELAKLIDAATVFLITMDDEFIYWPGSVADGRMLVLNFATPHTDLMVVEVEDRPSQPRVIHVYQVAEFFQSGFLDWTLHYTIGAPRGDNPLLSLRAEEIAEPDAMGTRLLKAALGPADVGRHLRTLSLFSEVMRETAEAS